MKNTKPFNYIKHKKELDQFFTNPTVALHCAKWLDHSNRLIREQGVINYITGKLK
jgi:hypothetical protein